MNRLALALWEGDRHARTLARALEAWKQAPPDPATFETDEELVRLCDQLLFRFTKLQDAIGERLVPATLEHLGESFESWPMRDRIDRLEKLGYVDATDWFRWRELRNRLAHEYPEHPERSAAVLSAAVEAAGALVQAWASWREKLAPGAEVRQEGGRHDGQIVR